jgi:RHS repeat-associated protein
MVAEYAYNQVTAPLPSAPQKEYGYRSGKMLVVWDGDKSGDERLKWLVTDHLGSTRMEADKSGRLNDDASTSGVLEGIRRHDYLPFGEELVASTGAQRSGVGYEPPASNVKQKFDAYERDNETGLDFAQARYFSSVQARFTSPDEPFADQDGLDPQSWNLYAFVRNNPTTFTDPTGRSTHTDRDGNVVAVYNDNDLGVYSHDDLSKWNKKDVLATSGDGILNRGETEYWDEFREHDINTGAILGGVAKDARIMFNWSFDADIKRLNEEATSRDLRDVAQDSKNKQHYDIKEDTNIAPYGPNTGKLLNGKYATARSAGNYLAGLNGATAKLAGGYIGEIMMMKLAGALQQRQFTTWNAFQIMLYGKSFGPAPWYGEIEHAGRRIQAGFRKGVSMRPKR